MLLITKRAKSPITLEDVIESNKKLEVFEKKEYISKATQNYTKIESNSKLIKDLKKIVEKNKKDLIKKLNKDLLVV